jgi:hypothetical protein
VFQVTLSGDQFIMRLTGDPLPEATISDVAVRWTADDKRFARGVIESGGDDAGVSA